MLGPRVSVAPPQSPDPVSSPQPSSPQPASALVPARRTAGIDTSIRIRVADAHGTRIVAMAIEEYVLGAVRAELAPRTLQDDAAGRILRVQALVARTYALANLGRHGADRFDLCDTTHCQIYRQGLPTEHAADLAARAVADTRGEVVTYQGHVIQALFHSNCGGHTASASSVWGGPDLPYLKPAADAFCAAASPTHWTFTVGEPELRRVLNSSPTTAVGSRLIRIDMADRDASGRAGLLTLAGSRAPVVRAEELRAVIGRVLGPQAIRSTLFTVSRLGDQFVFSGVGYGHGVGLCQLGANLRARAGQSIVDIISHYFPGARIQSATVAERLPDEARHIGDIP